MCGARRTQKQTRTLWGRNVAVGPLRSRPTAFCALQFIAATMVQLPRLRSPQLQLVAAAAICSMR